MENKLKILYVEDVATDAELAFRELKKHQIEFEQLVIDTEQDYLQALDVFQPDLILCDHSLPSFNSLQALRILKREKQSIPFILITATMNEDIAAEVVKEGADDYIIKDRLKRLPYAVLNAVEKYKYEQERKTLIDEVKKQEDLAREAMEKVYDMFSQAPAGIGLLKGPQHTFQLANDHYLKLLSRENIIGKTVREVFPEMIDQGLFELLDHVYATGETFTAHERQVQVKNSATGELASYYFNFIYQPYLSAKNEIEGVFFFALDVTEQVLLRQEIEKNAQQYRQIVDTAQEGIWLMNENYQVTFVNSKFCEIFGYGEKEIIGKDVTLIVKENPQNIFSSKNENYECQSVSKDGKEIWINISTSPIFAEHGNYRGSLAMVSNITERKKLDERNSFKANLLNTIGQAVVAVDANGIVNYWNNAAEKIYGWKEEEAIGKNILELTPSQQTVEQAKEIMDQLNQGNTWSGEFLVKRKDGSKFPSFVTDSPIYDDNRNLVGVIGVSSDITEKKKLEKLLDEANQLARVGNWEYDVEKDFIYWSKITKEIHEVENNFIPGVATAINFYKEGATRDLINEAVKHGLELGKPWDHELQIITAKGNERWVRTIGRPEFINGRCVRLYGSFQDIDDRKRNEEKLQQSEARFRALVENNHGVIVLRNEKLQIVYRTPNTEKLCGYAEHERMGQTFESIVHPEDKEAMKQHEKLILKTAGKSFSITFRLRHKKGHYVWVEVISTNLLHEPSVRSIVSNFRDVTDRKTFEEQQKLMASIVNSSDDAIISLSAGGLITSWNRGAQNLYHYTAREIIGRKISCLIPPYKLHEEEEIQSKVINGEHLERYETERLRKDGTVVEVSISVSPIKDGDGKIIGASKIARDITEIKKSEEIIKRSEKQYRELMEVLPAALYTCDANGRIVLYNQAATHLWGREPKAGRDKWNGAWKMFTKDGKDLPFDLSPMAIAIKTGKPSRGREVIIERPDGSRRNVLTYPTPTYGASGITGAVNMMLDITETRKYENALKESETQYRQIVETAQEGIWLIDDKAKTKFVNQKLCEILGYAKEEIIGKEAFDFLDEEGKQMATKGFEDKKRDLPVQLEVKFISKSGKLLWTSVASNPIFDENGKFKGWMAMVTDITEKINLQNHLIEEQVNKQKEVTKATISAQERERSEIGKELHDNVNQILGASSLYLSHSLQAEDYKTFIVKSKQYITEAIEEIRKLSKALVGPANDKKMGLVSSVCSLIDDIKLIKNLTIYFEHAAFDEEGMPQDLTLVIFRVIQEQLNNIFKHAEATEIGIELERCEEIIHLTVKDNGKGFEQSKKRKGIGLSNIINRAELYNGSVDILSSPGKGCKLKVQFFIPVSNTKERD